MEGASVRAVGLLLFVAFACCGGATTSATAPRTTEACWPVAPMRLFDEHAPTSEPIAEIEVDGTIYVSDHGSRTIAGRVSNDAFIDAHDHRMTCVRREVTLQPGMKGHYDAHDALVMEGRSIAVRDDGVITLNGVPAGGRIEGPIVDHRRTAILLLLAGMVTAPLMPTP